MLARLASRAGLTLCDLASDAMHPCGQCILRCVCAWVRCLSVPTEKGSTIKLAIDAPDRVNRLVVIGSAPVVHSLFCPMPLEGIKMIGGYYRGAGGPSFEKMKAIATTLVYDASNVTDDMIRERYEASIDPQAIEVNSGPPPERQDLTAEFSKVQAPTLVVWGMDDRFGALDVGLLMTRAFQNAEMHIFSKCGHWAQVEHAAEFNQLVLAFFGRDA